MFDVDRKIMDIDDVICRNLDAIGTLGRGLVAQNILAQTRPLLEYTAIKAYSLYNSDAKDDKETNKAALAFIRTNNKFLFIRKFHYLIQESKSHYTPNFDGAERLALKYYEYYILLREFVKNEYNLDILHNLELFPLKIDKAVEGYYREVTKSLEKKRPFTTYTKSRFYVMRSKPIYIDGEIIFENTMLPAGDFSSKFDRFIVFSKFMVADHYAIQACIFSDEIVVQGQRMPINILTDFIVSIRPCELNNFSRLFDEYINIGSNYSEYKGLMRYLTLTGGSITDILTSSDKTYQYIKGQVLNNAKTVQLYPVLDRARDLILANRPGSNIIRYLAGIMRNQVIKDQYYEEPNPNLSNLMLQYGCIPFEEMPFASSLVGHNTELCDIYATIDDSNRKHELLAKALQTRAMVDGCIYTKESELEQFENINDLVETYNDKLYIKHRSSRSINTFGNNYFINQYYDDTKEIINALRDLSANGIAGTSNAMTQWMNENPGIIDCDEKKDILLNMFEQSCVSLIYGAAGTGKTYIINHVSQFYDDRKKLYLANTNPAVDNLRRKVRAQNCSFSTVASFIKKSSIVTNYDIVVIDECSMVSNSDMRKILSKAKFRLLLLVGDTYQIESISFGNWFGLARHFLERKAWHVLTTPYRAQNDELLELWNKVRKKDSDITEYIVHNHYSSILDESIFEKNSEDEIILCLNYNGLYGINNINRFLQNNNTNAGEKWGIWSYKIGDPILFNETERFSPVLYNNLKGRIVGISKESDKIRFEIKIDKCITEWDVEGTEIELIHSEPENSIIGLWVYSNDEDEEGEGTANSIVPFQIAYAVSIHKAQGLEYDSVKVVITEDIDEMITHNIFYTAITRAKKNLKIYWSPESQKRIMKKFIDNNNVNEAVIFASQAGIRIRNRYIDA